MDQQRKAIVMRAMQKTVMPLKKLFWQHASAIKIVKAAIFL